MRGVCGQSSQDKRKEKAVRAKVHCHLKCLLLNWIQFCFALLRSRTFAVDNGIYQGKIGCRRPGARHQKLNQRSEGEELVSLSSDFWLRAGDLQERRITKVYSACTVRCDRHH